MLAMRRRPRTLKDSHAEQAQFRRRAWLALAGVALCVVATGALVVPARPELAARVNLALVAAGYALPVLMLFATLIVRRSPRLGAAAVLVADAGLVFVFALQAWSIVLGIVHVAGAAIAAVGAQRTSRERARRGS